MLTQPKETAKLNDERCHVHGPEINTNTQHNLGRERITEPTVVNRTRASASSLEASLWLALFFFFTNVLNRLNTRRGERGVLECNVIIHSKVSIR